MKTGTTVRYVTHLGAEAGRYIRTAYIIDEVQSQPELHSEMKTPGAEGQ